MREHLRRLFYTRSGDLDFGWLLLILSFANGLLAFDLAAAGVWHVTIAAWSWYGSVIAMAFISGAAIGRARLIAQSRVMGEVAQGIGSSTAEQSFVPHQWAEGDPDAGIA